MQAHLRQKHGVLGSTQARQLMAYVQPQPDGGQGVTFLAVLPGKACLGPVMKDLELSDKERALLRPQDSLLTAAAAKVDLYPYMVPISGSNIVEPQTIEPKLIR